MHAGLGRTAPHPSPQLVELGEPQAFGVVDDHQGCVRHVDAHLDDRGRHQDIDLAGLEVRHDGVLLGLGGNRPWTRPMRSRSDNRVAPVQRPARIRRR